MCEIPRRSSNFRNLHWSFRGNFSTPTGVYCYAIEMDFLLIFPPPPLLSLLLPAAENSESFHESNARVIPIISFNNNFGRRHYRKCMQKKFTGNAYRKLYQNFHISMTHPSYLSNNLISSKSVVSDAFFISLFKNLQITILNIIPSLWRLLTNQVY